MKSEDLKKSETLNKFKSQLKTLNLTEMISENCNNFVFYAVTNLDLYQKEYMIGILIIFISIG